MTCNTSNGRRVHGNRVDKRSRPVEVIYRLDRVKKQQWSGFKPSVQVGSQLSLLEVA